jgi:Secretion system C-terminal sorting domain
MCFQFVDCICKLFCRNFLFNYENNTMRNTVTFFLLVSFNLSANAQFKKLGSKSLKDFSNSFSIMLHVGKDSAQSFYKPYTKDYMTKLVEPLRDLGIKHVRDDINFYQFCNPCASPNCDACLNYDNFKQAFQRMKYLYQQTGVKFDLVIPYRKITEINDTFIIRNPKYIDSLFAFDNGYAKQFVEAIEGSNELNLAFPAGDSNWVKTIFEMQRSMFKYVRSRPDLAYLNILSPTVYIGGGFADHQYDSLIKYARNTNAPFDSLKNYVDAYAFHAYPSVDYGPWYGTPNFYVNEKRSELNVFGADLVAKPLYLTETGYHQGSAAVIYNFISETAQSKYTTVLFADNFKNNITRTNVYEMLDHGESQDDIEGQEGNFGLIRRDGIKKQVFYALKNYLQIVTPDNYNFQADSLNFNITGETSNVEYLLLRKNSKTYQLHIWQGGAAGSCYNGEGFNPSGIDIPSDTQKIKIKLPVVADSVRIFNPHTQANYIQKTINVDSVNVGVTDNVMVVDISFGQAVLPLQWLHFTASWLKENDLQLNWQTANEKNVQRFIIERALNAPINFQEIGSVKANNTPNNSYSFYDHQDFSNATSIFYRIKELSVDGFVSYSSILSMLPSQQKQNWVTIYPNPTNHFINMHFTKNLGKEVQLNFFAMDGKCIQRTKLLKVNARESFDVSSLRSGVFYLEMICEGYKTTFKLIKQVAF